MTISVSKDSLNQLAEKSKQWSPEDRAVFEGLLNTLTLQSRMIYSLEMRLQNFEDYFNTLAKNLDQELNNIGGLLSTPVSSGVNPDEVDKAIKALSDSIKNSAQLSNILENILRLAATISPLLLV